MMTFKSGKLKIKPYKIIYFSKVFQQEYNKGKN